MFTTSSIPFLPKITGTPKQISLKPYSPSNNTEHGYTFFWSQAMACTNPDTAAPGAYQADVPNNFVNVAPPTLVSSFTWFKRSSDKNSVTGTPFLVAKRVKGIIPVSLWPPITMPSRSEEHTSELQSR